MSFITFSRNNNRIGMDVSEKEPVRVAKKQERALDDVSLQEQAAQYQSQIVKPARVHHDAALNDLDLLLKRELRA